uniref:Uncharacterized protein n=1 Tax=Chromera velia CCMP2878 TaxID=1169474 RepID=A0A0G4I110_9ALVE|eukprot:Cvel_1659.t1-p1 / transcript=Cvel_1659.t1 / gene=Cvel_1659 / organism=Chromera_velia_CCMP2878 / gene_product=hypothetical protein / transcript_product=hypothetical protein / location=Cvel_scaffold59:137581-144718(+) / protein_length=1963 / sequence_SO=supercontig / SO=protein_coding / is_pseudo=false
MTSQEDRQGRDDSRRHRRSSVAQKRTEKQPRRELSRTSTSLYTILSPGASPGREGKGDNRKEKKLERRSQASSLRTLSSAVEHESIVERHQSVKGRESEVSADKLPSAFRESIGERRERRRASRKTKELESFASSLLSTSSSSSSYPSLHLPPPVKRSQQQDSKRTSKEGEVLANTVTTNEGSATESGRGRSHSSQPSLSLAGSSLSLYGGAIDRPELEQMVQEEVRAFMDSLNNGAGRGSEAPLRPGGRTNVSVPLPRSASGTVLLQHSNRPSSRVGGDREEGGERNQQARVEISRRPQVTLSPLSTNLSPPLPLYEGNQQQTLIAFNARVADDSQERGHTTVLRNLREAKDRERERCRRGREEAQDDRERLTVSPSNPPEDLQQKSAAPSSRLLQPPHSRRSKTRTERTREGRGTRRQKEDRGGEEKGCRLIQTSAQPDNKSQAYHLHSRPHQPSSPSPAPYRTAQRTVQSSVASSGGRSSRTRHGQGRAEVRNNVEAHSGQGSASSTLPLHEEQPVGRIPSRREIAELSPLSGSRPRSQAAEESGNLKPPIEYRKRTADSMEEPYEGTEEAQSNYGRSTSVLESRRAFMNKILASKASNRMETNETEGGQGQEQDAVQAIHPSAQLNPHNTGNPPHIIPPPSRLALHSPARSRNTQPDGLRHSPRSNGLQQPGSTHESHCKVPTVDHHGTTPNTNNHDCLKAHRGPKSPLHPKYQAPNSNPDSIEAITGSLPVSTEALARGLAPSADLKPKFDTQKTANESGNGTHLRASAGTGSGSNPLLYSKCQFAKEMGGDHENRESIGAETNNDRQNPLPCPRCPLSIDLMRIGAASEHPFPPPSYKVHAPLPEKSSRLTMASHSRPPPSFEGQREPQVTTTHSPREHNRGGGSAPSGGCTHHPLPKWPPSPNRIQVPQSGDVPLPKGDGGATTTGLTCTSIPPPHIAPRTHYTKEVPGCPTCPCCPPPSCCPPVPCAPCRPLTPSPRDTEHSLPYQPQRLSPSCKGHTPPVNRRGCSDPCPSTDIFPDGPRHACCPANERVCKTPPPYPTRGECRPRRKNSVLQSFIRFLKGRGRRSRSPSASPCRRPAPQASGCSTVTVETTLRSRSGRPVVAARSVCHTDTLATSCCGEEAAIREISTALARLVEGEEDGCSEASAPPCERSRRWPLRRRRAASCDTACTVQTCRPMQRPKIHWSFMRRRRKCGGNDTLRESAVDDEESCRPSRQGKPLGRPGRGVSSVPLPLKFPTQRSTLDAGPCSVGRKGQDAPSARVIDIVVGKAEEGGCCKEDPVAVTISVRQPGEDNTTETEVQAAADPLDEEAEARESSHLHFSQQTRMRAGESQQQQQEAEVWCPGPPPAPSMTDAFITFPPSMGQDAPPLRTARRQKEVDTRVETLMASGGEHLVCNRFPQVKAVHPNDLMPPDTREQTGVRKRMNDWSNVTRDGQFQQSIHSHFLRKGVLDLKDLGSQWEKEDIPSILPPVNEAEDKSPEDAHPVNRLGQRFDASQPGSGADGGVIADPALYMKSLCVGLQDPDHSGIGEEGEFQGRVGIRELARLVGLPPSDPQESAAQLRDGAGTSPNLPGQILKHFQILKQEEGGGVAESNHPIRRETEQLAVDTNEELHRRWGNDDSDDEAGKEGDSDGGDGDVMKKWKDAVDSGMTGREWLRKRRGSTITKKKMKELHKLRAQADAQMKGENLGAGEFLGGQKKCECGSRKLTCAQSPNTIHVAIFPGPKERKTGANQLPHIPHPQGDLSSHDKKVFIGEDVTGSFGPDEAQVIIFDKRKGKKPETWFERQNPLREKEEIENYNLKKTFIISTNTKHAKPATILRNPAVHFATDMTARRKRVQMAQRPSGVFKSSANGATRSREGTVKSDTKGEPASPQPAAPPNLTGSLPPPEGSQQRTQEDPPGTAGTTNVLQAAQTTQPQAGATAAPPTQAEDDAKIEGGSVRSKATGPLSGTQM